MLPSVCGQRITTIESVTLQSLQERLNKINIKIKELEDKYTGLLPSVCGQRDKEIKEKSVEKSNLRVCHPLSMDRDSIILENSHILPKPTLINKPVITDLQSQSTQITKYIPKQRGLIHTWDRFLISHMSKVFRKPLLFIIDNFYTDDKPEYISVFNLYTELIKKNDKLNFVMSNHGAIKTKIKHKKILPIIPSPPKEDYKNIFYDSDSFTSYAPLEAQDKFIKNIGDDL